MKKIELGQVLSIVANAGVIASIVFLAVEVRDNASQARVSAVQELASQMVQWDYEIASDAELARIYSEGLADYRSLALTEKVRFDSLMRGLVRLTSSAIRARDEGLVPLTTDLERRGIEGQVFRHLDEPGFREWWQTSDLRGLPPAIIDRINELEQIRTNQTAPD